MVDMFDSYNNLNSFPPDNRHRFCDVDETYSIVRGQSCYHTFFIPYKWSEDIKSGKILYMCGVDFKFEVLSTDTTKFVIEEDDKGTWITISISALDSPRFTCHRTTFAQFSLILNTNDKVMTLPCKIHVIDSIEEIK